MACSAAPISANLTDFRELYFQGPFNDYVSITLELTNKTSQLTVFKLKSTDSSKFRILPNVGYVFPFNTQRVTIQLLKPDDPSQIHSDKYQDQKFLLVSNHIDIPQLNSYEIENYLNKSTKTNTYKKLKCVLLPPDDQGFSCSPVSSACNIEEPCCSSLEEESSGGNQENNDDENYQKCYDFDMVEDKKIADYICCVCFGMIREAVQLPCCTKLIGNSCRLQLQKRNGRKCPLCNQQYIEEKVIQIQSTDNTITDTVQIVCRNDDECSWVGTINQFLESHQKVCPEEKVKCTNHVCKEEVKRKDLDQHLATCGYHVSPCQHCNKNVKRKLIDKHAKTCKIPCPLKCGQNIPPLEVTKHTDEECGNREVACPYREVGCNVKIPRCQLSSHINSPSHAQMLNTFVTKFKELQSENVAWRHQNETLESEIGVLKNENKDLTDQLANKEKLLQARARNLNDVLLKHQRNQEQMRKTSIRRPQPPPQAPPPPQPQPQPQPRPRPEAAVGVVKKISVTAVPVLESVDSSQGATLKMLFGLLRNENWVAFDKEIKNKAPLLRTDEKSQLFFKACSKNNIPLNSIRGLLRSGYFIRVYKEESCVYYPLCDGRLDVLKLLIEHDKSLLDYVDEDKNTLLHLAAMNNQKEIVKYLLSFNIEGCRLKKNSSDLTPAEAADDDEIKKLINEYRPNRGLLRGFFS
ncbi:uncharacterized protein [Clytia hemisphaerica]|uniref:Major sperm protein n=1 Tax=Clytia hemisphaerica TaxID=252671 RepID=A0A7M5WRL4_9CNID